MDFLRYLSDYVGEDTKEVEAIIESRNKHAETIMSEAFNTDYPSKKEAKFLVKNYFTSADTAPEGVDAKYVSENLDTIINKIDMLSEGDIRIIIHNHENGKKDIEFDEDAKPKKKRGRPRKDDQTKAPQDTPVLYDSADTEIMGKIEEEDEELIDEAKSPQTLKKYDKPTKVGDKSIIGWKHDTNGNVVVVYEVVKDGKGRNKSSQLGGAMGELSSSDYTGSMPGKALIAAVKNDGVNEADDVLFDRETKDEIETTEVLDEAVAGNGVDAIYRIIDDFGEQFAWNQLISYIDNDGDSMSQWEEHINRHYEFPDETTYTEYLDLIGLETAVGEAIRWMSDDDLLALVEEINDENGLDESEVQWSDIVDAVKEDDDVETEEVAEEEGIDDKLIKALADLDLSDEDLKTAIKTVDEDKSSEKLNKAIDIVRKMAAE